MQTQNGPCIDCCPFTWGSMSSRVCDMEVIVKGFALEAYACLRGVWSIVNRGVPRV